MPRSATSTQAAVARLCPSCGLCCNGVLFADVQLQPADDPDKLVRAGIKLARTQKTPAFPQPCACFDGALCRIYADRPQHCQRFECGLLKRVVQNRLSPALALRRITQAKRQAARVTQLLRESGQTDQALPITRRYAQVMAQPIDFAERLSLQTRRSLLTSAMDTLMTTLQRHFRT